MTFILHWIATELALTEESYVAESVEVFPVVLLSMSRHTVTYILQHQLLCAVTLRCWGSTCSLCFVKVDLIITLNLIRLDYHINFLFNFTSMSVSLLPKLVVIAFLSSQHSPLRSL